jgi:hypothetical protein
MATRQLPDAEILRKLLRYEPETGKLFWRERAPETFLCEERNVKRMCSRWNRTKAGFEAFSSLTANGYKRTTIRPFGSFFAHRVIWCMVYGDWPEQIDHINQDRSDNRLSNLQSVDAETNGRNCGLSGRNKSGRIGVHWRPREKKWRAKIRHEGRYVYLGQFSRFEDACAARQRAEQEYGYSALHGKSPTESAQASSCQ